jgi:prephenate dehydratase
VKRKPPVAFQGEPGAFSQQAIVQFLGTEAPILPCERFEHVFRALESNAAMAAAIPVENTLHGSVHENYDHLLEFDFEIVAETNVRIVHNLIAAPGVSFKSVRRVFSHPVAINQCLDFFTNNPQVERVPFYDTAGSVKMIISERLGDAAAIASKLAAETYGGRILRRSIEDDRANFTRFVLLRKKGLARPKLASTPSRESKTSLVFTTRDVPGALFRALSAFALRDVSLAKIESRPLRGKPWEYLFYLDLHGDAADEKLKKAIGHLGEIADFLRVLGSYPRV